MKPQYADWIAANVKESRGRCAEATLAMAAAFPELTRVRGHYLCWVWGVAQVGRSHSSSRPSKHYHLHNLANTSSF